MDAIKNYVLNIAAVAVLMIILDLLMPEGRIRKFTQLISGFIIMFVMINPILQLFNKGAPASYAGWSDEVYLLNNQLKYSTGSLKEDQDKQVLELYRSMLISDIKNRLEAHKQIGKAEVDVVLNENTRTDKFGEIRKLYINLVIDKVNGAEKLPQENLINEIRKELKQVLLLNEDKIIIYVNEEK